MNVCIARACTRCSSSIRFSTGSSSSAGTQLMSSSPVHLKDARQHYRKSTGRALLDAYNNNDTCTHPHTCVSAPLPCCRALFDAPLLCQQPPLSGLDLCVLFVCEIMTVSRDDDVHRAGHAIMLHIACFQVRFLVSLTTSLKRCTTPCRPSMFEVSSARVTRSASDPESSRACVVVAVTAQKQFTLSCGSDSTQKGLHQWLQHRCKAQ